MLEVALTERPQGLMVAPAGEIDISTSAQLAEALDAALARARARVIVDLRGVEFMDAAGASVLVRHAERAKSAGLRPGLVLGSRASYRVLELCGLLDRFELVTDENGIAA